MSSLSHNGIVVPGCGLASGGMLGRCGYLAPLPSARHRDGMDDEQGIYRDEVRLMMGALADIYVDTGRILAILDDEEDGDEAEELDS
jgi:hypothetical protein